jgi:hypothetical protein
MVRDNRLQAEQQPGIIADLGAKARKAQFVLAQTPEGIINEVSTKF